MSSQSIKERKAKENQVVFHNGSTYDVKLDEYIQGGICQVIHPFTTHCSLKRLRANTHKE